MERQATNHVSARVATQSGSVIQPLTRRADNLPPQDPSQPFFLGPSSELYDSQYFQLDRNFGDSGSTNEIIAPFPQPSPETFMSYWEYEVALLDWRASVERAVGGNLQLPQLVGRRVFRPQISGTPGDVPGLSSSSTPFGNLSFQDCGVVDTSPELSLGVPRSPRAEPSPSETFFSGSAGSSGGSTPSSLYSVGSSLVSDHLSSSPVQDPWDSALIPPEPNPHQYQTFDDYYIALLHWANICNMAHGAELPVPSSQLAGLVPLQRAAKSRANSTVQTSSSPSFSSRRRNTWQDTVQRVSQQAQFPGTSVCTENTVDIGVGMLSSIEHPVIKRAHADHVICKTTTTVASEESRQHLLQQMNKLLDRSHQLYQSTGRCSVRAEYPPNVSSPLPAASPSSASPCLLLRKCHSSELFNSHTSRIPEILTQEHDSPADDSAAYLLYSNLVSSMWPAETMDSLTYVSSALSAIIRTSTLVYGHHVHWEHVLLSSKPPFTVEDASLSNLVPTMVDCLLSNDYCNTHTAHHVLNTFVSEFNFTTDPHKRMRAARLFSILLQKSVSFGALLATFVRRLESCLFGSVEHLEAFGDQDFWSALHVFRGCIAVLSHAHAHSKDIFYVSPEVVMLAAGRDATFVATTKRVLFLHYCGLLSSIINDYIEVPTQGGRIDISVVLSNALSACSSALRDDMNLHSQSLIQVLLERLNSRSRTVSAVSYFVLSSLVRVFPEGPSGPWFAQAVRYLLRSRKRHTVIIATRFSQSQLLSSNVEFLVSFCSTISPEEILEDVSSCSIPLIMFWDAVGQRLIADAGHVKKCMSLPMASAQPIIKLQEIICKMRMKPDLEADPSLAQCRLLQARATLLATICQLVVTQFELEKADSVDSFQPRIPIQVVAKLIRFIQDASPPHDSYPQVGRSVARARAAVAHGVSLLLSNRPIYVDLSKSWKKGAKHLHKLTQPFYSKRSRSIEASRRPQISAVPASPALALLQSLVFQLKFSSSFEYRFGSKLIQSIVTLISSHSRLSSALFEPLCLGTSEKHHSDIEDQQPLIFHILDGLTVGSIGSNLAQWATGGLALPTHCIRLLTILFSILPERETKLLVEYIIKHHHFIKIHLAFRRIVEYAPGITLTVFGEFYRTVISNSVALRLRLADFLDGFERPLGMYVDGPELLKNARG